MEAERFRAVVERDGRVKLPPAAAARVGEACEVIVLFGEPPWSAAEEAATRAGLAPLSEEEVERIVHEVRGVAR
jgi:Glu-tRNA(Gln) amidotransferase subunit E-like FAD-binding protein